MFFWYLKLNDSSFPAAQFFTQGYSIPCRLDRNANGDGILYIRVDIPSALIQTGIRVENFIVELNLRRREGVGEWVLCCSYNPPKT